MTGSLTGIRESFRTVFPDGGVPAVASAPGRVNLIGEHTDYVEGFVLPMAIDRRVNVAFRLRADGRLRAHAARFGETRELDLTAIEPPGRDLRPSSGGWLRRVAGVWWALREEGVEGPGMDLVVDGDVPVGSGLSSSAAMEVAVARVLFHAAGASWHPAAAARAAQRAEDEFAGIRCGLMDPFVAAAARPGHALLLDCRSLEARHVPLPEEAGVLVLDTGVRRELVRGAYNERRAACERATDRLREELPGIRTLRDISPSELEAHASLLDETTLRRARHVVAENARPEALARCFAEGDLEGAGRLLDASHASLRDLYEVSSPELDAFVETAREDPRCRGARMTGAGFGGCAIALVGREAAAEVAEGALLRYRGRMGGSAGEPVGDAFPVRAAGGARVG